MKRRSRSAGPDGVTRTDGRRAGDVRVRRQSDPRRLVAVGAIAALGLLATLTYLLAGEADRARASVTNIRVTLDAPRASIDDTLESVTAGATMLQRAAAVTGDERAAFLSAAIKAGQDSTRTWTSYLAVAAHLDGEDELVAAYLRDSQAAQAMGGEVMVPIIQSNEPGMLPKAEVDVIDVERQDLIALQDLYKRADASALTAVDARLTTAVAAFVAAAGIAAALVLVSGVLAFRAASRVVRDRRTRAAAADLAAFEARLVRGLELVEGDAAAFRVAAKAIVELDPDATPSVVESDASQAAFVPTLGQLQCGVERPTECPAVKAGAPLQFADSSALDACPVLTEAGATPCSVTCMPVSVAGRDMAVLQLTGPVGTPPAMDEGVRLVVRRVGERVTMLRAFAQFELQASRDPLTGLLNRRSLEVAVERLAATGTPYAVAFADLDHFKELNDVHGHDAGDRALRAFATTMRTSLRPEDICCRWGGEEFIVVFPGCDQRSAVDAMNRVRSTLALECLTGVNAPVTVSVGISESDLGERFGETVARADEALRHAKATGRDRVELWRSRSIDGGSAELVAKGATNGVS